MIYGSGNVGGIVNIVQCICEGLRSRNCIYCAAVAPTSENTQISRARDL